MRPEYVATIVEGAIPFLGGIYATVLGFRVLGPKPGTKPKHDEWHRRWGGFMRVGGPLIVVFGIFLWVKGFVSHPGSAPILASTWTRHKSSDGVVSVEYPASPASLTQESDGVVNHNLTLSQKDRDRNFIMSWSEVIPMEGVSDEERLDGLREWIPAMTAKLGTPLTFVSEKPYSDGGCIGRVFVFEVKGKYSQRMKCLIVGRRMYRAIATTPYTAEDEADGIRFVSTFRLEKKVH